MNDYSYLTTISGLYKFFRNNDPKKQYSNFYIQKLVMKSMKKGLNQVLILLILLSVIPLASASLVFTNSSISIYSLGDEALIALTVSGNSNQTINDFLSVDLYCDTKTLEIYKTPLRLSLGEEKTISFSTIFDKTLTNSMTGQCFFRGTYAKESVDTKRFEISSDVSLTASSFYSLINPGTDLNITGSAIKKNGLALNGYASITSAELAISKITEVKNGSFTTPISIPANTKAKDYIIFVEAYDQVSNHNTLNRRIG